MNMLIITTNTASFKKVRRLDDEIRRFQSNSLNTIYKLIYVFRDGDPLSGIDDHLDVRFVQPSRVHLSPYPRYVYFYVSVYIHIT
jgi:hypothetical protein